MTDSLHAIPDSLIRIILPFDLIYAVD